MMPPIEQVFDSRDDAPDWLRSSLLEQDGKFVFRQNWLTKSADSRRRWRRNASQKAEAKKRLKGYEGVDVDQYQKLMAERDEIRSQARRRRLATGLSREEQLKKQLQKPIWQSARAITTAEISGPRRQARTDASRRWNDH
jgi:hypothetical protein